MKCYIISISSFGCLEKSNFVCESFCTLTMNSPIRRYTRLSTSSIFSTRPSHLVTIANQTFCGGESQVPRKASPSLSNLGGNSHMLIDKGKSNFRGATTCSWLPEGTGDLVRPALPKFRPQRSSSLMLCFLPVSTLHSDLDVFGYATSVTATCGEHFSSSLRARASSKPHPPSKTLHGQIHVEYARSCLSAGG
jgi:hypothetical protein